MIIARTRLASIAAMAGSLLAACATAGVSGGPGAGGYTDATKLDGVAMVASESRCNYSYLFSTYALDRQSRIAIQTAINLRGPAHIAGAPVSITVRGAFMGDPGTSGTVTLQHGKDEEKGVYKVDGAAFKTIDFTLELRTKAVAGDNRIVLSAHLPKPDMAGATQAMQIDSLDIGVDGDFCISRP
jgi:hypothetical protein